MDFRPSFVEGDFSKQAIVPRSNSRFPHFLHTLMLRNKHDGANFMTFHPIIDILES
jgi:hypothetical protein